MIYLDCQQVSTRNIKINHYNYIVPFLYTLPTPSARRSLARCLARIGVLRWPRVRAGDPVPGTPAAVVGWLLCCVGLAWLDSCPPAGDMGRSHGPGDAPQQRKNKKDIFSRLLLTFKIPRDILSTTTSEER